MLLTLWKKRQTQREMANTNNKHKYIMYKPTNINDKQKYTMSNPTNRYDKHKSIVVTTVKKNFELHFQCLVVVNFTSNTSKLRWTN